MLPRLGLNASFASATGEPRFATLLYVSLADQLLARQRYTEAAEASLAFVERHPRHPLAPSFESRAMAAWTQGGFTALLIAGKARYVERYAPGSAYWQGAAATPEVLAAVKDNLAALGRHHHASAQARPVTELAERQADFLKAADWYARSLQLFPNDAAAAELALLQADAARQALQTLRMTVAPVLKAGAGRPPAADAASAPAAPSQAASQ